MARRRSAHARIDRRRSTALHQVVSLVRCEFRYDGTMTLKAIEGQSQGLIRIHKGALVNPAFINQSASRLLLKNRSFAFITMQDGKMLSVARRRWRVLVETNPEVII
ncbi:MAG: LytTR family transcriptional regulator [Cytophagaceae bacterium]|nr:MAG: LytTR family transcriptional regulator [Cytophagaceae bacterium]